MSSYFHGPKPPGGKVPLPASLGGPGGIKPPAKAPAKPAAVNPPVKPPATRVVTVRQHTRTIAAKQPVQNTAKAEPATPHGAAKRFYHPLQKGQKPSGYEPVGRRPGRAGIGSPVTSRPYWLATKGPTGDQASQLNAAQVAQAKRAGVQKSVPMKVLDAAVHPLTDLSQQALGTKPFKPKGAASDVANIASNFVPVGKAAGILGSLRGLRALKGAKAAVDVAEAAKPVEQAAAAAARPRTIEEARTQLAALDAQHKKFVDSFVSEKLTKDELAQQRAINTERGKFKRQQTGKTKAGKASGASGYRRQMLPKTINEQKRAEMEAELDKIVAANPEHPGAKAYLRAQQLRDELRAQINAHEEQTFLGGSEPAAAAPKPAAPPTRSFTPPRPTVSAEEASAALRAAVSGKSARQALKRMSEYEKIGAKLDPTYGKSVRQLQKEQKVLYSQERGKRFAAARVHLDNPNLDPAERVRLAKNELRGELPKIKFQGFTELSDAAVTAMQKHILDHPLLHEGQKIRASDALTNALTGKLPTPSELKILEYVFGKDTTEGIGAIARHPFKDTLLSVMNVPRSLMASFDLSAPFRQGLTVATRHPVIFARNFKPMIKAFGNEEVYHATLAEIRSRPTYPLMMEGRLSLTELGTQVAGREEQFQSDIAEHIPGIGRGVRASGRAYTGFLDKTRADVFDHLIQRAQTQGSNIHDDKFLKDLGRYVNSTTGRGPLGSSFQGAASALNAFFFSPRLLASRLDLIFSPITYAKADPFVRREAIRSMVQLAGTASVLLALAAQVKGAKVVLDPRNPDWGKIRFGNTRIDIGGGFQQPLRLFAQLATGVAISSTTGKKLNLTAGGFGQPNRLDLFLRFFEGKESPIASYITDWARNSDQVGNKFSWDQAAYQRLLPLLAQDSYDLYKAKHGGLNGIAAAFGGYAVGSVGFGLQTYGSRPPASRGKAPSYFGDSSSGGGSSYFTPSSTSGGGSSYFAP